MEEDPQQVNGDSKPVLAGPLDVELDVLIEYIERLVQIFMGADGSFTGLLSSESTRLNTFISNWSCPLLAVKSCVSSVDASTSNISTAYTVVTDLDDLKERSPTVIFVKRGAAIHRRIPLQKQLKTIFMDDDHTELESIYLNACLCTYFQSIEQNVDRNEVLQTAQQHLTEASNSLQRLKQDITKPKKKVRNPSNQSHGSSSNNQSPTTNDYATDNEIEFCDPEFMKRFEPPDISHLIIRPTEEDEVSSQSTISRSSGVESAEMDRDDSSNAEDSFLDDENQESIRLSSLDGGVNEEERDLSSGLDNDALPPLSGRLHSTLRVSSSSDLSSGLDNDALPPLSGRLHSTLRVSSSSDIYILSSSSESLFSETSSSTSSLAKVSPPVEAETPSSPPVEAETSSTPPVEAETPSSPPVEAETSSIPHVEAETPSSPPVEAEISNASSSKKVSFSFVPSAKEVQDDDISNPSNERVQQMPSRPESGVLNSGGDDSNHENSNDNDVQFIQEIVGGSRNVLNRPARKRRRMVVSSDDEAEERLDDNKEAPHTDRHENIPIISNGPSRKRKSSTTIKVQREERERLGRLEMKQRTLKGIKLDDGVVLTTNDNLEDSVGKRVTSLVLDRDENSAVEVHPNLVYHLKPHQAVGVQFLYNCTIESLDRICSHDGGGGVLSHSMGLGKTFQIIAFLYSIMTHRTISQSINKALIVCPTNVIRNWIDEFMKWLGKLDGDAPGIEVYRLSSLKPNSYRLELLKQWHSDKNPSVMLIGYNLFYSLTTGDHHTETNNNGSVPAESAPSRQKFNEFREEFRHYLQNPGPHIVVCDEGHMLKNSRGKIVQAMEKIKTKRRLCLTGTPLQNSLSEYYTMINFVKPGLLGGFKEFQTRFIIPIQNGQMIDSDDKDVRVMRKRCHVLHSKLKGIIDRPDFNILKNELCPKLEYVIKVRLTSKQTRMYRAFLATECSSFEIHGKRLVADYHTFARIFTHPYLAITYNGKKKNSKTTRRSASTESEEQQNVNEVEGESPIHWLDKIDFLTEDDRTDYTLSYKLMLMIEILKECGTFNDKVLLFSQSLETLNLICDTLGLSLGWVKREEYAIITGSTPVDERDRIQKSFNDPSNAKIRLCLISTRAGSLGTNFVGANRVIIFDQCWNPSHDRQALFRVYRFGQTKPVYIYRFVAFGTLEDKIYARQVMKESISGRVVDEHQIERHYTNAHLAELYELHTDEYDEKKTPLYKPPEDRLLANVFMKLKEGIVDCIQHDFLLAHREEEVLTEQEREEAWTEYERSIHVPPPFPIQPAPQTSSVNQYPTMPGFNYNQYRAFLGGYGGHGPSTEAILGPGTPYPGYPSYLETTSLSERLICNQQADRLPPY